MHINNSNIYLPATLIGTLKHLLIHTIVKLAKHVTALQYMKMMQIRVSVNVQIKPSNKGNLRSQ